jgi:hypothetical protein
MNGPVELMAANMLNPPSCLRDPDRQTEDEWRAPVTDELPETVNDIPDAKLISRAVRGARPRNGRVPRWSAVGEVFALGSTFSIQLCRRFGVDPDEQIGRTGRVS